MTHITMVKKILADGTPCRKCRQVSERMERDGLMERVDRMVTTNESDPDSEGTRLAVRHNVTRAPFFIVRHGDGSERVYESYLRFRRDVASIEMSPHEVALDLAERLPDLDYL